MANEMKNLSEEILASYKKRLKDNEEMVNDVQKTLDGFRNDHMEMATTLRSNAATLHANIAKGQRERLKSFNTVMTGIRKDVKNIQISTTDLLKDFTVSHHEMAGELNEMLAKDKADRSKWNTGRLEKFEIQMKGIQTEVMHIFNDTHDLLKKFDKEHLEMTAVMREELHAILIERVAYTKEMLLKFQQRLSEISLENQKMAKALRKDLSQNDAQRLKDFNVTFTGIQNRVHEIEKYVNTLLNEFSTDRKQAAATWGKMAEAIAVIKKSFEAAPVGKKHATAQQKPVMKKEEAKKEIVAEKEIVIEEEAKKEIVAEKEIVIEEVVKKAEPVVEKPKVAEPQKALSLEEKVLNYINTQKNGVKVSDMEKPFGETRMRIGFIAKKLLDEGKVQKVDNLYYPLAKNSSHEDKNQVPLLPGNRKRSI